MSCTYNLRRIPCGTYNWSGPKIPELGDRVRINFNQLGAGVVQSYFIEHGYLGVLVKLDQPPAWHQRTHPPGSEHHGIAHVFGLEITILDQPRGVDYEVTPGACSYCLGSSRQVRGQLSLPDGHAPFCDWMQQQIGGEK